MFALGQSKPGLLVREDVSVATQNVESAIYLKCENFVDMVLDCDTESTVFSFVSIWFMLVYTQPPKESIHYRVCSFFCLQSYSFKVDVAAMASKLEHLRLRLHDFESRPLLTVRPAFKTFVCDEGSRIIKTQNEN